MYFQFIIYLCVALSNVVFARIPRIIGGENADIRDYPYSVSIRLELDRYKHICGGAIISHHHILTAAQCVYGINAESIVIYIGRTSAPDFSVRSYTITKIKIHPKFIGKIKPNSKTHNDIAVLTTLQYIIFSGNQNQINLPTADVEVGANAVITSWGMTSYPNGYTATTLQKASMVIVPNSECANNLPFPVYNENLCAVQGPGVGTCYGDNGSPLVSNEVLVGISSIVHPCVTGKPDVYTRVFPYLNFITSSMTTSSRTLLSYIGINN